MTVALEVGEAKQQEQPCEIQPEAGSSSPGGDITKRTDAVSYATFQDPGDEAAVNCPSETKVGVDIARVSPHSQFLFELMALAAFTKSGLDYLAPALWFGLPGESAGWYYVVAALLWLGGCGLWAVSLFAKVDVGVLPSLAWTVAGGFFFATLASPKGNVGVDLFAVCCGYVAGVCWLLAGFLWMVASLRLIRVTLSVEVVDVALWFVCGFAFYGTCAATGLDGPSRWMGVSSTSWWLVGCTTWALGLRKGVAFFTYGPPRWQG